MAKTRIAVVGVGHLGKHHARLLAGHEAAELVGVADISAAAAEEVGALYSVSATQDYRELVDAVDAVCVAVPTRDHREVAGFFLERGVDVLVEKPITATEAEGRELVALACEHRCLLQVGHVERFNPAMRAIAEFGIEPRYIEAHRLAPFTFRSMDIGVVMDLMIHDIDLVLSIVGCELRSVDAFGGSVFTASEDMASAILKFENGAVAHLTANRVALKPMRKMRAFSPDAYVSVDFQDATGLIIQKNPGCGDLDLRGVDTSQIDDLWKFVFEGLLTIREYRGDASNPLLDELTAFLEAAADRSRPPVDGEAGCEAVALANQILEAIARNPWRDA